MAYTLSQAARVIGRDRSTLQKAVQRGILSAQRDPVTHAWRVDPAELERVYGLSSSLGTAQPSQPSQLGKSAPYTLDSQPDSPPRTPDSQLNSPSDVHLLLAVERTRTAGLEARLGDLERMIEDLRQRLDRADQERRQAQEKLTAVLTDQRPGQQPARRSWWRWW